MWCTCQWVWLAWLMGVLLWVWVVWLIGSHTTPPSTRHPLPAPHLGSALARACTLARSRPTSTLDARPRRLACPSLQAGCCITTQNAFAIAYAKRLSRHGLWHRYIDTLHLEILRIRGVQVSRWLLLSKYHCIYSNLHILVFTPTASRGLMRRKLPPSIPQMYLL